MILLGLLITDKVILLVNSLISNTILFQMFLFCHTDMHSFKDFHLSYLCIHNRHFLMSIRKNPSSCHSVHCVKKHLSFFLMLHYSVPHRTTFFWTSNYFGQRLEHWMSYPDNKILFISVVFHYTLWLRNKMSLKSSQDTSLRLLW